jgi:hypothetical protein
VGTMRRAADHRRERHAGEETHCGPPWVHKRHAFSRRMNTKHAHFRRLKG